MSTDLNVSNQNSVSNSGAKLVSSPFETKSAPDKALYSPQPATIQEMVTRRINKMLCFCLLFTIIVTFISYYIAMNFEAKLNVLDREIVRINTENLDLQTDLDRYKSFNNVDSKIGEFKLLQKADKVLEVTALNDSEVVSQPQKAPQSSFNWAIGY